MRNEYTKKNIDEYLIKIEKNKGNDKLDWIQWQQLLFEYCDEYKCVPKPNTKYKNQLIYHWLCNQKNKINSIDNELYIKLSVNEYVKESLDKKLVIAKNNEGKKRLKWEELKELLFKYCDDNKRTPTRKTKYMNIDLNGWLQNQKAKINSIDNKLYIELSVNKYVKKSLDQYLEKCVKKLIKND